ncbi:unnamed protein product [Ixodes pacificus]
MADKPNPTELSFKEMKFKVCRFMEEQGIVSDIRARLRYKFVEALKISSQSRTKTSKTLLHQLSVISGTTKLGYGPMTSLWCCNSTTSTATYASTTTSTTRRKKQNKNVKYRARQDALARKKVDGSHNEPVLVLP